jgi:hypothetical protein
MAFALLLAATGLAGPTTVLAQAWLPPKGDASLTLGYQYYRSSDRFTTSNGDRYYDGLIQQHGSSARGRGSRDVSGMGVSVVPTRVCACQGIANITRPSRVWGTMMAPAA